MMPLLFSMPDYLTTVFAELQALFLLFFLEKPVYACGISDGSAGVRWIVFDQKPMRMDALT
jgi:hypothetical protein